MPHCLIDSSIYISALRKRNESILIVRNLANDSPLWLSAVVLEELYAGTSSSNIHVVERLHRDFEKVGRVLVPNLTDWARAGIAVSRLAAKHNYEQIGRERLTNDALIATSAGRLGIEVLTANQRDFEKLSEFCNFRYRVITI